MKRNQLRWDAEDGQVMVLVSLMMVGFLGMVALVIDLGFLYTETRSAQAAADAAALAAAQHRLRVSTATTATLTAVARSYASDNGFAHGVGGVTVTVNIPPTSGTHTTPDGSTSLAYIEVIVKKTLSGQFSGVVFQGLLQAHGRSVAGVVRQPSPYGLIALRNDCDDEALEIEGNSRVTVNNGGVMVNSCDPEEAMEVEGNARLTADPIDITGGYEQQAGTTITGTVTTGVSPAADPLAGIPRPTGVTPNCGEFEMHGGGYTITNAACVAASSMTGGCESRYVVVRPGIYEEFEVDCGTVWLLPGIYVLGGDGDDAMEIEGNGVVKSCRNPARPGQPAACGALATSDGVLLFASTEDYPACGDDGDDGGEFEVEGNGVLEIQAATTGTYAGLAIFGDPCADDDDEGFELESGATSVTIDGTVYLPNSECEIKSGAATINGGFYCKSIEVEGSANLTVNYNNPNQIYRPPAAVLLE